MIFLLRSILHITTGNNSLQTENSTVNHKDQTMAKVQNDEVTKRASLPFPVNHHLPMLSWESFGSKFDMVTQGHAWQLSRVGLFPFQTLSGSSPTGLKLRWGHLQSSMEAARSGDIIQNRLKLWWVHWNKNWKYILGISYERIIQCGRGTQSNPNHISQQCVSHGGRSNIRHPHHMPALVTQGMFQFTCVSTKESVKFTNICTHSCWKQR